MTAPPGTRKRRTPRDPALSTRPSDVTNDTNTDREFDYEQRVVYQVDSSIWRAIYRGEFRLAVQCDTCGRWLTAGASKKAHRGPRCAAKVVG